MLPSREKAILDTLQRIEKQQAKLHADVANLAYYLQHGYHQRQPLPLVEIVDEPDPFLPQAGTPDP